VPARSNDLDCLHKLRDLHAGFQMPVLPSTLSGATLPLLLLKVRAALSCCLFTHMATRPARPRQPTGTSTDLAPNPFGMYSRPPSRQRSTTMS
jgi:hypothetical protein